MTASLPGTDEYIDALLNRCADLHDEVDALQQINVDLLAACEAALQMIDNKMDMYIDGRTAIDLRAAIAKARGVQLQQSSSSSGQDEALHSIGCVCESCSVTRARDQS